MGIVPPDGDYQCLYYRRPLRTERNMVPRSPGLQAAMAILRVYLFLGQCFVFLFCGRTMLSQPSADVGGKRPHNDDPPVGMFSAVVASLRLFLFLIYVCSNLMMLVTCGFQAGFPMIFCLFLYFETATLVCLLF